MFFPVDLHGSTPPDLLKLIASRDALRELYEHLLEVVGLMPKQFAGQALIVAARLVDAELEIHTLVSSLIEEQQLALEEGRGSSSWDGVQTSSPREVPRRPFPRIIGC